MKIFLSNQNYVIFEMIFLFSYNSYFIFEMKSSFLEIIITLYLK